MANQPSHTPPTEHTSLSRFFADRVQPLARDWMLRRPLPEDLAILGSALIVGVGTGFGAVLFLLAMRFFRQVALYGQELIGGAAGVLIVMGIAGFLVGLIVWRWAREAAGSGVPDIMEAVAIHGGYIRHRVAEARILATSITIGAGGSAGHEGPVAQMGASLGSTVGQLFHFSEQRMRTLVAAGAAAGIAAVFNAPIAGTIFAMEVVLSSFNVRYFGAVVISAVAASVVSDVLYYNQNPLVVPAYPLYHFGEIPIYAVLGILSALFAILFVHLFYGTERLFDKLRVPIPVKTALGMVLVGLLALQMPEVSVLGAGLGSISSIISANVPHEVHILALILVGKLFATSLTLGSGNSGGVFAPSLFMGAMLGGIVGLIANRLFPGVAVNPGAYAIVGAAAVFAGAARGPITAVLIVFEMSGDYQLILPLMTATVLSAWLSESLMSDSIYTRKLSQKGISWQSGRDMDILQSVTVAEVMTRDVETVPDGMTISELSDRLVHSHSHGFPILDDDGRLAGIVSLADLDRALVNEVPQDIPVMQIGTPQEHLLVVTPEETMGDALSRMGTRGLGRLPVVDPEDDQRLIGVIVRAHIIRAYDLANTRRAELQHRAKSLRVRDLDGTEFVDVKLRRHDPAVGQTVQDVAKEMPQQCILVSVRRQGKMLIPHGDTVFEPGDRVTAFVTSKDAERFKHDLCGGRTNPEHEPSTRK